MENALEHETISQVGAGVKWFSDVFGDRHSGHILDPGQPGFSPAMLLRLVRLARPEDDVQHESSYSRDIRDYAERGRDALVSALLAKNGVDGFAAKLALAADPMCAHFKDRVLAVARERAAEDADGIALSEANLVALNRYCEAPPTSRDALFAVMEDRLSDIDDLLLTDISPRQAWALVKDETVMRKLIAREFEVQANHAYTVDQEAVTADEKETDIRLRATASHDQAIIELKIGDKRRSGAELRQALKEQLVAKYMAAWQHPGTGTILDFPALISMLNEGGAQDNARNGRRNQTST